MGRFEGQIKDHFPRQITESRGFVESENLSLLRDNSLDKSAELDSIADAKITRLGSSLEYHGYGHQESIDEHLGRSAVAFAIVESCVFVRECVGRSLNSAFVADVFAFSTVAEMVEKMSGAHPTLVLLSMLGRSPDSLARELSQIAALDSRIRTVVLAQKDDLDLAFAALRHGAKGYIPMNMGFDIATEAIRFVIAGGTYVPAEFVMAARSSGPEASERAAPSGITGREMAVIRAIRQGKPNKIIAYELNLCESTVKVHVRHIMKKLKAKNRTDLAIKSAEMV